MEEERKSVALMGGFKMIVIDVTKRCAKHQINNVHALSRLLQVRMSQIIKQRTVHVHNTDINSWIHFSLSPALPLQTTECQTIQNENESSGKGFLTSDDSAVEDLSPRTDSCPKTETPTETDASFKTEAGPSTPGPNRSPQPKKGTFLSPVFDTSYISTSININVVVNIQNSNKL